MEKLARSTDPKQQSLRDLKKEWQKEMKVFIAQSIALKRGIAGRGDAQAGLPPSNIKDPLPPEISTYIEEMSSRFNNLANIARQIVEHQEEYSKTRRHSQKEIQPIQASYKMASTPLSRIWSIWTQTPWFKDDKATKTRLRLLSSLSELQEQINDVEYVLAGQDKKALTHSFFTYLRFLGLFRNRFIDKINFEVDRQRQELTGVKKEEFDNLLKTVEVKNPSEAFQETKKKLEESRNKAEQEDAAKPDTLPKPEGPIDTKAEQIVRAKNIVADLQSIKPTIARHNSLVELKAIEGEIVDINEFKSLANELIKIATAIVAEKEVDFNAFQKGYKDLLSVLNKKLNQKASSFEELYNLLMQIKKADRVFEKVAAREFERWMRRMTLSLYFDEFSKSKLDTVKKLRNLSLLMNAVMDLLERKDTKIAELFIMLSDLYKEIAVIAYDFVQFANNHNTFYGQQRASGEKHDIGPINQIDITSMANEVKKLVNDVQDMQGKSISGESEKNG